MLLKVTVVNFPVPGVIFDLDSFNFQVPIWGSAAKHAATAKKQNARVNPIVFFFMCAIESGFSSPVKIFSQAGQLPNENLLVKFACEAGTRRRTHCRNYNINLAA